MPAKLFIVGGGEIESTEGTTQGDTFAMAFYGLGTNTILVQLKIQVADDATGPGKVSPSKK